MENNSSLIANTAKRVLSPDPEVVEGMVRKRAKLSQVEIKEEGGDIVAFKARNLPADFEELMGDIKFEHIADVTVSGVLTEKTKEVADSLTEIQNLRRRIENISQKMDSLTKTVEVLERELETQKTVNEAQQEVNRQFMKKLEALAKDLELQRAERIGSERMALMLHEKSLEKLCATRPA